MKNKIELYLNIRPRSFQRAGIARSKTGKPYVFKSPQKRAYQDKLKYRVINEIRKQERETGEKFKKLSGPVKITELTYYFNTKKLALWEQYRDIKPDLGDNLNKPLLDVLKDLVMGDDEDIVAIDGLSKRWAKNPSIHIVMEEV